jgi:uncharacterized protein (DUF2345 family)
LNYMGASIAISGSTIVVGAYGHNNFQGVGYVFVAPAGGWADMTQTAELTASDGKSSADFGFSAAMNQETVVMGAVNAAGGKGAAYIFVEPSSGWANMTQTAELHAPKATAGDSFGQSAAINSQAVVIGAPSANVGNNQLQGAAYVFRKPGSGWKNSSTALELTSSDGATNDAFALSVGVSGTTAVAGAIRGVTPGAAYVFGP